MVAVLIMQVMLSWPVLTCESDSHHWLNGTYCVVTTCCYEHEDGSKECETLLEGEGCYRITGENCQGL